MTTKAANTGNGYPSGMKNRIINGGMDIAQRGTSFAAFGGYTLDRWVVDVSASDAVVTTTQNADVPASKEFQNSLRVAVTTADTSITSAQQGQIYHFIEGYNVRDLISRTFTVSFWVRSSKTGIHCAGLLNSIGDRSYVAEYTIAAANTWQYTTFTVMGGLPATGGTWNYTNGRGIGLRFGLACGTTYQTTAGVWQAGNYIGTSNQVNCLDTIGNIFAITGVQLELGPVATPFEHRLFGAELALCQRYFCKSSSTDIVVTNGSAYNVVGAFKSGGLSAYLANVGYTEFQTFPVPMRASLGSGGAVATFFNCNLPAVPTAGQWCVLEGGTWVNTTAIGVQTYTTTGMGISLGGTWSVGARIYYGAWTVDAEL